MIIQSKFKDYYDFCANIFGGGDPKVVYSRGRLAPIDARYGSLVETKLTVETAECPLLSPTAFNHRYAQRNWDTEVAYLIVAGKLYLLSRQRGELWIGQKPYRIANEKDDLFKLNPWSSRATSFGIEARVEHPFLIELSRLVGGPVFVIEEITWTAHNRSAKVTVQGQCPILKDLGMASIVPANTMYQDLAYFMGNLMHNTPDVNPPAVLSEKERIVKAGFDLKQSFRHRT
jgi:hypothetical protein